MTLKPFFSLVIAFYHNEIYNIVTHKLSFEAPGIYIKLFFVSQGPSGPAGSAGPAGPRGPTVSNNFVPLIKSINRIGNNVHHPFYPL